MSIYDLLFSKRELNIKIQIVRFVMVGVTTVALDFCTLVSLVEYFNVNYLISATFGFLIGSIANYFLSVRIVFIDGKHPSKILEFTYFLVITLIGLILNYITMYIFTEIILMPYFVSKFFSLFFVASTNFLMKKFFVFKG